MIATPRIGSTLILNGEHTVEIVSGYEPETGDYHEVTWHGAETGVLVDINWVEADVYELTFSQIDGEPVPQANLTLTTEELESISLLTKTDTDCPQCGYSEVRLVTNGDAAWTECDNEECTYRTDPS